MKKNSKRLLVIPPSLAYGAKVKSFFDEKVNGWLNAANYFSHVLTEGLVNLNKYL